MLELLRTYILPNKLIHYISFSSLFGVIYTLEYMKNILYIQVEW